MLSVLGVGQIPGAYSLQSCRVEQLASQRLFPLPCGPHMVAPFASSFSPSTFEVLLSAALYRIKRAGFGRG